jgi:hypothetical protein
MRRSHVLVVAAITLSVLGACGSSDKDKAGGGTNEVASLSSPQASVAAKAERPRERLDTTSEEYEVMLRPYNKCIEEHGGAPKGTSAKTGVAKPASKKEMEKFDQANRICEPQYFPLPPWEKDPANPEAKDFARDVVKCLKDGGVQYVEVDDDGISIALGGDQNDSRSISKGMDMIPGCERKVAAAAKK